jgi:hypothetical protein
MPDLGMSSPISPFVAAIGDPSRIRRYRDIGAYLGLYQGS